MVVTIANLGQVQMEVLARHAAVGMQPVLGVAPEALDAVAVIPADKPRERNQRQLVISQVWVADEAFFPHRWHHT